MQQGLRYDKEKTRYYIGELEVSLHNQCNLQCKECGFFIPHQKQPFLKDSIEEIAFGLEILENLQIHIDILVVTGGEPLINKDLLEKAVIKFKQFENVSMIEVVSNGLLPKNLSKKALEHIDQFTISKYFQSDTLIDLWNRYISRLSPSTKLNIREKTDKWDKWWGNYSVNEDTAQKMFDQCFYRRHCITIERGRLFPCSRIAKDGNDDEGLILSKELTIKQIESYLNSSYYLPSCLKCTPMMGLPKVKGGIQPDNRIEILINKAIIFLEKQINS